MIEITKTIKDVRAERTNTIREAMSNGIMDTHEGDTMETYNVNASLLFIVRAESRAEAESNVREIIDKKIADGDLNAYRDFLYTVNYGIDWD